MGPKINAQTYSNSRASEVDLEAFSNSIKNWGISVRGALCWTKNSTRKRFTKRLDRRRVRVVRSTKSSCFGLAEQETEHLPKNIRFFIVSTNRNVQKIWKNRSNNISTMRLGPANNSQNHVSNEGAYKVRSTTSSCFDLTGLKTEHFPNKSGFSLFSTNKNVQRT